MKQQFTTKLLRITFTAYPVSPIVIKVVFHPEISTAPRRLFLPKSGDRALVVESVSIYPSVLISHEAVIDTVMLEELSQEDKRSAMLRTCMIGIAI